MCIVIDLNALPSVFNPSSSFHCEFSPIRDWIDKKLGFLVYGGSAYKNELKKTPRYLRLIRLLKDSGKAIPIMDDVVDKKEKEIIKKLKGTKCDDQHIIALLGVSRCPLLCSLDSRSYKHIKNRRLYPKSVPKVKIYSSSKNRKLLISIPFTILMNTT